MVQWGPFGYSMVEYSYVRLRIESLGCHADDSSLANLPRAPAMLRITLLSGEELTSLPLTELSDVKALKQRLHQEHGLPPRFRQRLLHEGKTLDDAVALDSVGLQAVATTSSEASETERKQLAAAAEHSSDLQVLITGFAEVSVSEQAELCEAAREGLVVEAGQLANSKRD